MHKIEYIIYGELISSLSDFIKTFSSFYLLAEKNNYFIPSNKIPYIISNKDESIVEIYDKRSNYIDENLNCFSDYVWFMTDNKNEYIEKEGCILIRILGTEHLKQILGFEVAEEEEKKNLKGYIRDFPNDQKGIDYSHAIYEAAKNRVPGNMMFEKLLLIIINTKKVRLQLE